MAPLSTWKRKKNKRGIKVSSLSCTTQSSIPVKYKILQEGTEGKEEKKKTAQTSKWTYSRADVYILEEEELQ